MTTALAMLLASACVSASVSYGPPPERGAPSIPWIRSGAVIGQLFYYGASGPWKAQPERVIVPTRVAVALPDGATFVAIPDGSRRGGSAFLQSDG